MDAAPFRITLWQAKKVGARLSRLVNEECLNGAVLCAQQWLVWSRAAGRGKRPKFDFYRVETRRDDGAWCEMAQGALKDARSAWTVEDDARIETAPDVRPLIDVVGTTRTRTRYVTRGGARPQTRLAALVQKVLRTQ